MKTTPDPVRDPQFADVVARLRAQAAPEPSADFTERTLARARQASARRAGWADVALRAAAALAVLCGAGVWWLRAPAPVAQAPSPVEILMAAQRTDGGWSADARQLRARYDVSVTALAVLALLPTEIAPLGGQQAAAVRDGLSYLIGQQGKDGKIGEDFSGSDFTHYLAGMALQAAARLPGADPAWQAAAARARHHLPDSFQMAKLNAHLAHPDSFPARWVDAGGPVAQTALTLLAR
ncbi:MAG: hypothetical protein AB7V22_06685 [Kiritimatiellia bacterium]